MRNGRNGARPHRLAAAVAAAVLVAASCGGGGGTTTASPEDTAAAEQPAGRADAGMEPTSPPTDASMERSSPPTETAGGEGGAGAQPAPGTYRGYSPDLVADPAYETTILFFHAPWCPECRAFDESIRAGSLPDGVQILQVDYDSETGLKQRYGVTLQSTFVRVDADGEEISSWVGYGKDRSIDTILGELG